MPFVNKPMVREWIGNNLDRHVQQLEDHVPQNLQTALENLVLAEYRTPSALYVAYKGALDILKGTDDTTAIQYLESKLAENEP